ncbi:3-oxoacyl-[acyl-carrier-protein] synthase III C-terminal domain-containing protein [Rhizobium alvei]|uniref:3-oxoacyl-[acyl-carrier-protein] synthase III C-terminal domain-containing protein n=1 Tax=Rhizobium alvei TaxID=1132659 RepID=A0ABT8YSI7_9HYPH|nr:3-oxoacyl-[acyl-carrier-protein] synthase III C-terminal domain-containing protein [Rhizobium alvei]MDO6966648.1 3-oxoacyl-[acyl-carrier-protein] synthase III C-terminal domain-containing protein [Rhizobium alvei]
MVAISSIGTYLPKMRLERAAIAQAMGWLTSSAGTGKGSRSLAFWDEDSVTMAVEAARNCLADQMPDTVRRLVFASMTAPFAEFQNAVLVHGALRLGRNCLTEDTTSTRRAGLIALHQALEQGQTSLVVAAEIPKHPAGSSSESKSGDGAAAVLVEPSGDGLLCFLGGSSITRPFADRYRATGRDFALEWEERWIREEGYLKIVPEAISAALKAANLSPTEIDHFVLPSTIAGCAKAVGQASGLGHARLASDLAADCGDTGSAHALLMLAGAMEGMKPGEKVLVAEFGQGATALIFEAGPAIATMVPQVSRQIKSGLPERNYLKLAIFRGMLEWDRGLRGRVQVNEALTTAYRRSEELLGFVGGRNRQTGTIQFPPSRIAATREGLDVDALEPYPLADRGGTIATSTADLLAFSRHPPNCYGLVDFNGDGRLMMDFTDPGADQLKAGDAVRFVFRIKDIDERTGFRRYFWKAIAADTQSSRTGGE